MTGIRSDVGIKIFGDDIERLVAYGDEITAIVLDVEGVQDARAEAVSGFPQITINYDKDKLALYGLNVSDLNDAVSMGFAGTKAGVVYEQEKKFDLVVRLAEPYRQDVSNINNLYVTLPSGNQIPLGQVANVGFERGPAQISREDGKRRIIVGFNVRGRDVESVVNEIQTKIANQIKLPTGYYFEYAGQFENLQRAQNRLSIAVPLALVLIFILLYLTFHSIIQSILIFTAIPLSAIGGVFALWLRDMPFSISAGIGFIALFGVAVLNGIVLVAYFNQLKASGMTNIVERIKTGTAVRLRPVIMTAAVASLGFLPMALSTSAGAEVQKPLATVVIGGLITATLLTLIVLPVLYYYSEVKLGSDSSSFTIAQAQDKKTTTKTITTVEEAIEVALENHPQIKSKTLQIQQQTHLKDAAYTLPKMNIQAAYGQFNSKTIDQSYAISQSFNPFLAKVKKNLATGYVNKSKLELAMAESELKHHIKTLLALAKLLEEKENLYKQSANFANEAFQKGETGSLEKYNAALTHQNVLMDWKNAASEGETILAKLEALIMANVEMDTNNYVPKKWVKNLKELAATQHPQLKILLKEIEIAQSQTKSIKGLFEEDGELVEYDRIPRFHAFDVGIQIPVFGKSYKANTKASKIDALIKEEELKVLKIEIENHLNTLQSARQIKKDATEAYLSGALGFNEYLENVSLYFETMANYFEAVQSFNKVVFDVEYLVDN